MTFYEAPEVGAEVDRDMGFEAVKLWFLQNVADAILHIAVERGWKVGDGNGRLVLDLAKIVGNETAEAVTCLRRRGFLDRCCSGILGQNVGWSAQSCSA